MSDDNITKLPINFKAPPSEQGPMLKVLDYFDRERCNHTFAYVDGRRVDAQYLIREGETEVECGLCSTKLDPMFVLKRLAHEETKWDRDRRSYQEEMKRLSERRRTKCDNCGKMTRITCR